MTAAKLAIAVWLIGSAPALDAGAPEKWSDAISGLLVAFFAWPARRKSAGWADWAICFIGVWLLFAPLVLWTRSAAHYANDTFAGTLLILVSVALPVPRPRPGPEIPPGWSYNPSTWRHRMPIVAIGFLGFLVARYMAAFQLGHIDTVWEPFFDPGTAAVLKSSVSEAFPISDAGLGAVAYLLECASGVVGDQRRWRTMPWMVVLFFILVVPAGVVSVVLVVLQPVIVGAWCTPCLVTAALTLLTIPPAVDEVIASGQFMARRRREGAAFWRTFFLGDVERPREEAPVVRHAGESGLSGLSAPWNVLLSALLGAALVAAPGWLGAQKSLADTFVIVGALVMTFSVLAIADATRAARWLNVVFGLWLAAAGLIAGEGAARIGAVLAGLSLIPLSLPRGEVTDKYGGWEKWIR